MYKVLQSLKEEYQKLHESFDSLTEMIKYFEEEYDHAADPDIRYSLKKKIEREKAERTRVEIRLRKIEQEKYSYRLYEVLRRLDYHEQVAKFVDFQRKKHQFGAFLIHGDSSEYGQDWLVNRLIRQLSETVAETETEKVIRCYLSSQFPCADILWHDLAREVEYPGEIDEKAKEEIVLRICEWWETLNVFLIVRNLNILPFQEVKMIIKDFWIRLARKAKDSSCSAKNNYLLMFLTENEGYADKWRYPFAGRLESIEELHIPVKLKKLNMFGDSVVKNWFRENNADLPLDLKLKLTEIVKDERGNRRTPMCVLKCICQFSNCEWDEWGKQWMSY